MEPTPVKVNILKKALEATENRCGNYGTMPDNAKTIAAIASAVTRENIDVDTVFAVLVGLKLQRLWDDPTGMDHFVDLAGWSRGWADYRQGDKDTFAEGLAELGRKGLSGLTENPQR